MTIQFRISINQTHPPQEPYAPSVAGTALLKRSRAGSGANAGSGPDSAEAPVATDAVVARTPRGRQRGEEQGSRGDDEDLVAAADVDTDDCCSRIGWPGD